MGGVVEKVVGIRSGSAGVDSNVVLLLVTRIEFHG